MLLYDRIAEKSGFLQYRKPLQQGFLFRSSNPRHHQNLIYFDVSKLAKRPVLGRHRILTGLNSAAREAESVTLRSLLELAKLTVWLV